MVVLLGVVDAEADRHVPQEGLGRRRHALRREVLSNMKGPLVGARAELKTFQSWAVEAAVLTAVYSYLGAPSVYTDVRNHGNNY